MKRSVRASNSRQSRVFSRARAAKNAAISSPCAALRACKRSRSGPSGGSKDKSVSFARTPHRRRAALGVDSRRSPLSSGDRGYPRERPVRLLLGPAHARDSGGRPMSASEPPPNTGGGRRWEPLGEVPALDPLRHPGRGAALGPSLALLVGTKKGAFFLTAGPGRERWTLSEPAFLGHIVHHAVLDPRDRRTLLLAARTGHLGPTVFRSTDAGRSWREARRPPAFPKPPAGRLPQVVEQVFFLAPAHASEPGAWYAGTTPEGLFRSEDAGDTWEPVAGFNEH